jgi:hypothetical protein
MSGPGGPTRCSCDGGSGPFSVSSHAEMKVAARLRAEFERTGQPQHVTIVQNNEPCRRKAT